METICSQSTDIGIANFQYLLDTFRMLMKLHGQHHQTTLQNMTTFTLLKENYINHIADLAEWRMLGLVIKD